MNGHFIGVMTGTSLDGIDLVLADISESSVTIRFTASETYPEEIRHRLSRLITSGNTTLAELGQCEHVLGEYYASKINGWLTTLNFDRKAIIAIGNHGQTIWHQPHAPHPFTMQIGDNNRVAALTGIPVVGDVRRMDMAYGGQGAPLVPAFHDALFRKPEKTVVAVNIGGIANISVLDQSRPVYGFDTGPGNTLMDIWVQQHCGEKYDKNATMALQGSVNQTLLAHMLQDPYFSAPAPKSTGREYFNAQWLNNCLAQLPDQIKTEDVQATLCELTVSTIVNALPMQTSELIVCGGGCHNPLIMKRLKALLPQCQVHDTWAYNLDPDFIEAAAFAWLAHRRCNLLHGNCIEVTGASQPAILGAIYQP
nr:anhydro-N-acetylmuramic acid kinase [Thaumasiovibrio subtropicus]